MDLCRKCYGLWLDKGEIYHYCSDPKKLYAHLQKAYAQPVDSEVSCPRCRVPLKKLRLEAAALDIEACASCGGNWLDEGEIAGVNRALGTSIDAMAPDRLQTYSAPPAAAAEFIAEPSPAAARPWKPVSAAALSALPNLAFCSWGTVACLYGSLVALVYVLVAYLKINPLFAFGGAALALLLNFLAGPALMDFSLRWLHGLRWCKPEDLPPYLRDFIAEEFRKRNVAFPSVGIIEDGNPNAFAYGQHPGKARIVLTRGLLRVLNEREVVAVIAHEIGHVMHWDMAVMTFAALVPILLYSTFRFCMSASKARSPSSGKKGGNPLVAIGLTALLLHYVTEYLVLLLSRTREYHADRYSGQATRDPNALVSALVKIAYGLAGRRRPHFFRQYPGRHAMGHVESLGGILRGEFDAPPSR